MRRREIAGVAIGAPTRDRHGRNDGDRVADHDVGHGRTDGADDAGRFITEPRGKHRRLHIEAGAEHGFRSVHAQRTNLQLDLVRGGRRHFDVIDPQHFGTAIFMKTYDTRHVRSPTSK